MKLSNLHNFLIDENFKKIVEIPMETANLINSKFIVKDAHKSFGRLFEDYTDGDKTITVLDELDIFALVDKTESNYLERRFNGLSSIERVYYRYENKLNHVFPEFEDLMATLVMGEFKNMARESCIPNWIIEQVIQAYEDDRENSKDIRLEMEFKVAIDTDTIIDLLKDSEFPFTFENREPILSYIGNDEKKTTAYLKFMNLLKEKNAPLKMYIQVCGYYDNDREAENVAYLDNFDKDGFMIKDCGTVGNFNFDYKDMIDTIFNELHK